MMESIDTRSQDALAAGGALSTALDGFVPRPAQQRLAGAIADAFEGRSVLLASRNAAEQAEIRQRMPVSTHRRFMTPATPGPARAEKL